ncbi:MAG: hypothetical protein WCX46_04400 [Candidatus Paceibacterota bacterium]
MKIKFNSKFIKFLSIFIFTFIVIFPFSIFATYGVDEAYPVGTLTPTCAPGSSVYCTIALSGTGITSLNGLSGVTQTFSIGDTGTDFMIDSTGSLHTFNIPDASSLNRGLLTPLDWSAFNNKAESGANTDITSLSISDYIDFTSTSNPSYAPGRLFYDDVEKSLAYYNGVSEAINIGGELFIRVKNNTGSTIYKGQIVYLNGNDAGVPTIALAKADDIETSESVSMAREDILAGEFGHTIYCFW